MAINSITDAEFRKLKKITKPFEKAVGGCQGLYLAHRDDGQYSWILRLTINGKRIKRGIGSLKEYSTLSVAREAGQRLLIDIKDGKERQKKSDTAKKRFSVLVGLFISDREANEQLKNSREVSKECGRLNNYAVPFIGKKYLDEITVEDCAKIYKNAIAHKKGMGSIDGNTATADKTLDALNVFFTWATAKNLYPRNTIPPSNRKLLSPLIPKSTKGQQHLKGVLWRQIPRLISRLASPDSINNIGSMCAMFCIITCVRQHMVIGRVASKGDKPLLWGDIDDDFSCFHVKAAAMKVSKNGNVTIPLSTQARKILRRIAKIGITNPKDKDAIVFTLDGTSSLSDATMNKRLRTLDEQDIQAGGIGFRDPEHPDSVATMHATIRASFQSWFGDNDIGKKEVAEMCLFHSTDKLNGAYDRAERLKARKATLQQWADFCFSECPDDWDKI